MEKFTCLKFVKKIFLITEYHKKERNARENLRFFRILTEKSQAGGTLRCGSRGGRRVGGNSGGSNPRAEISVIRTGRKRKIQRSAVAFRQIAFLQKLQEKAQLFLKRGGRAELQPNAPVIQHFGII